MLHQKQICFLPRHQNWYKMRLRQELAEWINFKWDGLQTAAWWHSEDLSSKSSSTSITSLAAFSSDLLLSQIHRNPFLCLWKVGIKRYNQNQPKNFTAKNPPWVGFKSPRHAPRARQPRPGTSVAMVADSSNPKFGRRLPSSLTFWPFSIKSSFVTAIGSMPFLKQLPQAGCEGTKNL